MAKVQHIVLVRFKDSASTTAIAECFDALARLQDVIPGIEHCSFGPYASPEGLGKGFTHAFVITFTSPQARDAYLPHPDHEVVKDMLLKLIDDVVVFDYEF